ncbi:hypothetical protein I546_7255 [Mycobacterium kansasii 732]|nr:hypothetical protein I546_7255 [Mycobacterium kansasii 732]
MGNFDERQWGISVSAVSLEHDSTGQAVRRAPSSGRASA